MANLIKRSPRRSMRKKPYTIDEGWRQLGEDETIQFGDLYWWRACLCWEACKTSIGQTPKEYANHIIFTEPFIVKRKIT